ncbi:MAG: methionyl-tRNA formyltransferase [Anaerolineales bacterium]|nr:methionyl-tRNA formyltransferase [Anaerolineales bacterium]
MSARIVFMGSPDFARPSLQRLQADHAVVGVVTQPDRPFGRGRQLAPPPVKELALQLGIPVIQPERLREPAAMQQLQAWAPDVIVVAAFGQILRQAVLDLPPHGCINVHASLLPRWRGASPIQAAILHGDTQTGVTIMRMDAGLDTGPILSQRAIPIQPEDTAGTLSDKLAGLGAELLAETLPGYLAGGVLPQPQPQEGVTVVSLLNKADGELDPTQPAEALARRVRAFQPWPGAYLPWAGGALKVQRARVAVGAGTPGARLVHQRLPALGTADGLLLLEEVHPPGKKPMSGADFLRGNTWEAA